MSAAAVWPATIVNPFDAYPKEVLSHMAYLLLRAPYLAGNDRMVAAATVAIVGAILGETTNLEHVTRAAVCSLLGWTDDESSLNMVSHGWAAMEKHGLITARLEPHSGNPEHNGYDPELEPGVYWQEKYLGFTGRHPMQHPKPDIDDTDTVEEYWCEDCQTAHPMKHIIAAVVGTAVFGPDQYELVPYIQCPHTKAMYPRAGARRVKSADAGSGPVYYEGGRRDHFPRAEPEPEPEPESYGGKSTPSPSPSPSRSSPSPAAATSGTEVAVQVGVFASDHKEANSPATPTVLEKQPEPARAEPGVVLEPAPTPPIVSPDGDCYGGHTHKWVGYANPERFPGTFCVHCGARREPPVVSPDVSVPPSVDTVPPGRRPGHQSASVCHGRCTTIPGDAWECRCGCREWKSCSNREGVYCDRCGCRRRAPAAIRAEEPKEGSP